MRCQYQTNKRQYPRCTLKQNFYCSRLHEGIPLCPYKDYEREIPPVKKISVKRCEYQRRITDSSFDSPLCIFNIAFRCDFLKEGQKRICPYLKQEEKLNQEHDKIVKEIYGEIDYWFEKWA